MRIQVFTKEQIAKTALLRRMAYGRCLEYQKLCITASPETRKHYRVELEVLYKWIGEADEILRLGGMPIAEPPQFNAAQKAQLGEMRRVSKNKAALLGAAIQKAAMTGDFQAATNLGTGLEVCAAVIATVDMAIGKDASPTRLRSFHEIYEEKCANYERQQAAQRRASR